MGHYGGNEHAYSNGKYRKLVIKTFGNCKKLIPRRRSSLDELELKISSRINGQRVITTNFGIFSRHLYYLIKEKMVSFSGLYLLAAKLSLVPVHFMAVNNCEKYRD
jgi:hypothetical protein